MHHTHTVYNNNFSIEFFNSSICFVNWEPSCVITEHAMTGRDTPQARPKATFDSTKTYGTFLSSQRRGKWSKISNGSVSAAITMNWEIPLFKVLVASFAPFLSCLKRTACSMNEMIDDVKSWSAKG